MSTAAPAHHPAGDPVRATDNSTAAFERLLVPDWLNNLLIQLCVQPGQTSTKARTCGQLD